MLANECEKLASNPANPCRIHDEMGQSRRTGKIA